jgi:nitroreductase
MSSTVDTSKAALLEQLLQERYSCRAFLPEAVERPTIERMLIAAQRTASWCNAQPWQIAVLGGSRIDRVRAELLQYAATHPADPDFPWPAEYQGPYQERRRECGLQLYKAVGVRRGDREAGERQRQENFRFFGAPHVALVTTDRKLGVYGAIDCGAWVSNFMLAARSLGIDAIAQAALAAYPSFWRQTLGLGSDRLIVCGVSFGRADVGHPANSVRTSRANAVQDARWFD